MKLFYLNDEPNEISVKIMDTRYNPSTGDGDYFFRLKPAEGQLFEVLLPDNSIPYIKKWKGIVMISYILVPNLADLGPVLPDPLPPEPLPEDSL